MKKQPSADIYCRIDEFRREMSQGHNLVTVKFQNSGTDAQGRDFTNHIVGLIGEMTDAAKMMAEQMGFIPWPFDPHHANSYYIREYTNRYL